jgi:serine/threonine-protein kinase
LIFTVAPPGADFGSGTIVAQSLSTGERTRLVTGSQARFDASSGNLVYVLGGRILASTFSPDALGLSSASFPIVENVRVSADAGAQYAMSDKGAVVYVAAEPANAVRRTLVWVDRQGVETPVPIPPNAFDTPRVSPDGRAIAVTIRDVMTDVWTYDLSSPAGVRLGSSERQNMTPVWRPDGRGVTFAVPTSALARRRGDRPLSLAASWPFGVAGLEIPMPAVFSTDVSDRARPPDLVWQGDATDGFRSPVQLSAWSADGRVLTGTQGGNLWLLDATTVTTASGESGQPEEKTPWSRALLVQTPFEERDPMLSPDGRWLAFTRTTEGRHEIYVQAYPSLSDPHLVSNSGGVEPLWSRDGRELFYRETDRVMASRVATLPAFSASEPKGLFRGPYVAGSSARSYDVSPDGQRFLMIKIAEPSVTDTLHVLRHWSATLSR